MRPIGIIGNTVSLGRLFAAEHILDQRRHHRARRDRVDADILARHLERSRICEADNAPFAGAIDRRVANPITPNSDDVLTIAPPPFAVICGNLVLAIRRKYPGD